MNRYLKWGLVAAAIALFAPVKRVAAEEFIVPTGQDGKQVGVSDFAGWPYNCYIDAGVGTTAIECSSNTVPATGSSTINTTGPGEVLGVYCSTGILTSSYIILRDSATANTVSSSTMAYVYATGSATQPYIKFPVPLRYWNGLSVNASAAPGANQNWIIFYRPYKPSY